jgi:DNA-binding transcriptional LysR family regulator
MDWSLLQGFLELGRYGSLSAASRALGVSQPTLSRRLATLETSLGVSLFLRGPRGLTLTAAGERLVKVTERMREAARAVPEVVEAGHDPVSGVVRVTVPEAGLATDWLPRALLPLRKLHPGLLVEISVENRLVEMGKREADIAMRNQRPTDEALTARSLGTFAWYLYASPQYLAAHPPVAELSDLRHQDVLVYETPDNGRQGRWLSHRRLMDRVVLRSNSLDALARAARLGWGVAMLPAFVADRDPALSRVLPERPITRMPLWLVTHVELKRSPRVQAVFRLLIKSFEPMRELAAR